MPRIDLTATVPLFQVYNPASRAADRAGVHVAVPAAHRPQRRRHRRLVASCRLRRRRHQRVEPARQQAGAGRARRLRLDAGPRPGRRAWCTAAVSASRSSRRPSCRASTWRRRPHRRVRRLRRRRCSSSSCCSRACTRSPGMWKGTRRPARHPRPHARRPVPVPARVAGRRRRRTRCPSRSCRRRSGGWRGGASPRACAVRRPARRRPSGSWRSKPPTVSCGRATVPPHHVFGAHLRRCPWCDRLDGGLPDPFPGPTGVSSLERRPPPWTARARSSARTWVGEAARWCRSAVHRALAAIGRRLRSALTAAARWIWHRVRGPLRSWVPLGVAAGALAAAAPFVAGLVLLASGAITARWRGPRARTWWRSMGRAPGATWGVTVRWGLVVASAALLAVHGSWWWPLP